MDSLIIIIGVVGFAAFIISIHILNSASQPYPEDERGGLQGSGWIGDGERSPGDRRNGDVVLFPLLVNGTLVPADRRLLPDRRCSPLS